MSEHVNSLTDKILLTDMVLLFSISLLDMFLCSVSPKMTVRY